MQVEMRHKGNLFRTDSRQSERSNNRNEHAPRSRGFSLIELLVVLAISLVVAAFAVPSVITTIDAFRIHGTVASASGLIQQARVQAIKRAFTQRVHFANVNNRVVLFATTWNDPAVQPLRNDAGLSAQLWLPNQFTIPGAPAGAGAPGTPLTAQIMWGTTVQPDNINVDPYFNSRGMPCLPDPVTQVCNFTKGFVYYYRYQSGARTRWAATSISPVGRIQSWFWNGTSWGN